MKAWILGDGFVPGAWWSEGSAADMSAVCFPSAPGQASERVCSAVPMLALSDTPPPLDTQRESHRSNGLLKMNPHASLQSKTPDGGR